MSIFDFSNLTKMNAARAQTALDKRYNFSSIGVITLGEFLTRHADTLKKYIGDYSHKFERRKFNRMTGPEQAAYEARLKKPCFNAEYKPGFMIEIPKLVYDALTVPERS